MASEATVNGNSSEGLTPAQKLMEQHAHNPTVEEVPDEEDIVHPPPSAKQDSHKEADGAPALSEKAAGKQKATETPDIKNSPAAPLFNTASEELFPALGPAKRAAVAAVPLWGRNAASIAAAGANGVVNAASNAASQAANAVSNMDMPSLSTVRGPAAMALPGKNTDTISFKPGEMADRKDLKKPLNDLINDINKRSKAKLSYKSGGAGGVYTFQATGPKDAVHDSLMEIGNEVGRKVCSRPTHYMYTANISQLTQKISVPASVRPFIIGKGGAKIQEIQKRSGARVQVPKPEAGEDEDDNIDIVVEGNAVAIKIAMYDINRIVNERTSTVNLRLKDIPAEFYPFLAGPHNTHVGNLENGRDVRIQIPHYTTWDQTPPRVDQNKPVSFVPQPQFPIQISGDRDQAQQIQAELERRVQQLRRDLTVRQQDVERGRHQFIVGDRGGSLHDFLKETGCSLILPPNSDDSEDIYVVGPPDRIEGAIKKLNDLADSMQLTTADAAKTHKGEHAHAHNLTRYLRQRQALEQLERQHEATIVAPRGRDAPTTWEIYAKDSKNLRDARGDITSVFQSHPPSRFSTVPVDPFYHQFLQQRNAQHVRDNMGVHVVFPEDSDDSDLILVYEGQTPFADYTIPRGVPAQSEIQAYQQGLRQAQEFIQGLTRAQQNIVSRDVGANPKFYNKIERFVDKQQQDLPRDVLPVQIKFGDRRAQEATRSNPGLAMRGPSDAVDDLAAKILAFIEQEEKDELERGQKTSFDFPQKYANILIGKGGENIRKLREEYDVNIDVNDGKVVLTGPQAKANACKAHILSMAKRLEDEATHTLKIKSQYHRELIGAKGSQVNRLQDRYNVRINFPRSNKANDDEAGTDGGQSQRNSRGQPADEVVIRGPRRGADEAREELLNLLQYIIDNSHADTVSVAQSQVPSLIGSGGREMENMRQTTGAQIDVPGAREGADPSGRAEIKIKGTKKQVEEAKKLIQERAKIFDDTVVKTVDVERKHHRTLIGGGGKFSSCNKV